LASITDGVIATDTQARVTSLNQVAEALTGWSEREAKGVDVNRILNLVSADTHQPINQPFHSRLSQDETARSSGSTLLMRRDGAEIAIEDYSAPIRDHTGKRFGAVFVFRDVTERRKIERVLQESESRFRTVANNVPMMIWMSGAEPQFSFVNWN